MERWAALKGEVKIKISVIGNYPVDGSPEPCYLVEILIEEFQGELDFAVFTQEVDGLSKDNWQMPWDEHILDDDGLSGQLAPFPGPLKIRGSQRLAFFFHYLDLSVPLTTPMGPVPLPKPSPRPDRLAFIKYEAPD